MDRPAHLFLEIGAGPGIMHGCAPSRLCHCGTFFREPYFDVQEAFVRSTVFNDYVLGFLPYRRHQFWWGTEWLDDA